MTFTEGTDYFWFTNKLIYTGTYISSALSYNGDYFGSFELDMISAKEWAQYSSSATIDTPSGEILHASVNFFDYGGSKGLDTIVWKDGCED